MGHRASWGYVLDWVFLRAAARRKARASIGLLRSLTAIPGEIYVWIYVRLRLNRVFHRLGLGGAAQIRLMPRRMRVDRRFMHQPYWVPVEAIRWGGRPSGGKQRIGDSHGCGLIFGGDWDREDKREIMQYLDDYIYSRTVFQFIGKAVHYTETEQYREMARVVGRGEFEEWQARGCRSEADIAAYFEALRETFRKIKAEGYKTQEQLGSPRWYDEIKVFVDRNGELHKQQGAGHHRLSMAILASLSSVPVLVVGVHRDWALSAQREMRRDVITSIDMKLRRCGVRPYASP